MNDDAIRIIKKAKKDQGWVMEPQAKEIFSISGLKTTNYRWARTRDEALKAAKSIGFPVTAKIVSPQIVHKTEVHGVILNIMNNEDLISSYDRLSSLAGFSGVIIEGMENGVELIIGSKNDHQFGTVILVGLGGTSVEIYKDVSILMAPAREKEITEALNSLQGSKLLRGYRGAEAINFPKLTALIKKFSVLAWELREYVDSIDCNPVFASERGTVIADARFILK